MKVVATVGHERFSERARAIFLVVVCVLLAELHFI